jgi:hypothetical protein
LLFFAKYKKNIRFASQSLIPEFITMKKLFTSSPAKNLTLSVVFSIFILSVLTADAANPKRGRGYHHRYTQGNAEGVFSIGAIAGVNRDNIDGAAYFDNDYMYAYHAGIIADIGVAPIIMVQPQLLYNVKGVQSSTINAKLNMNYVEFRPNAKLLLTKSLSVLAGPYFGLLMSAKASYEGVSADVKDNFSPFDFGLNGAVEYKLKMGFGLGLQYSLGLADINTNSPGGYTAPSRTHNVVQLSLFYLFTPNK